MNSPHQSNTRKTSLPWLVIGLAAVITVGTFSGALATRDTSSPSSQTSTACLTPADVIAHADRSRSGVSLTCNDVVLLENTQ